MASSEKAPKDFIIGEADDNFQALPTGQSLKDPDDFILGQEEEPTLAAQSSPRILKPSPNPIISQLNPVVSKPESTSPASELDFTSIGDLIDEELGHPKSKKKIPVSVASTQHSPQVEVPLEPLSKSVANSHHVQTEPVKELGVDLGEDQKALMDAQMIHDQIFNDLQGYGDAQKPLPQSSQQRQAIRGVVREYQEQIRDQQSTLQDLIGSYIREGEFDRVATVDKVKRQLDNLLLEIRVLENRLNSTNSVLENKGGLENKSPSLLYEPLKERGQRQGRGHTIYDNAVRSKPGKAKKKAQRKPTYRDPGMVSPWFQRIKLILIASVFLSTIPAYYLSANWGVQKIISVDVAPYTSVIPLEKASRSGNTFNGIVETKWRDLPRAEREDAVRQLLAMVKVDGFEAVYLRYVDGGMVTMVHSGSERVFVQ